MTKEYKLVRIGEDRPEFCILPRETYIQRQLRLFNDIHPVLNKNNLILTGFNGKQPENGADGAFDIRESTYLQLMALEIFEDLASSEIPGMKNGHNKNHPFVERILMLRNKDNLKVIGGVRVFINVIEKHMEIKELAVLPQERKQGLGSCLLNFVIILAGLYGVDFISLLSTREGLSFYLKYGFYHEMYDENDEPVEIRDITQLEMMTCPELTLIISECRDVLTAQCLLDGFESDQISELLSYETMLNSKKGHLSKEMIHCLRATIKMQAEILNGYESIKSLKRLRTAHGETPNKRMKMDEIRMPVAPLSFFNDSIRKAPVFKVWDESPDCVSQRQNLHRN